MDDARQRRDTLFVVPHYLQAEKLNKELPEGCLAIAPGAALCGRGFKTIIVLRAQTTWGPDTLAWKPEHEERWFEGTLYTRLLPGGKVL